MQTTDLRVQRRSALSHESVLPKEILQHLQRRGILGPPQQTQQQLQPQQPPSSPSISSMLSHITSLAQHKGSNSLNTLPLPQPSTSTTSTTSHHSFSPLSSSTLPPLKLSLDSPVMASAEFRSLLDQVPQIEENPEHLQAAATLMDTLDAYSDALQTACAQLDGSNMLFNTPTHLEVPPVPSPTKRMQCFPPESVQDFKHVLYNLLVENHNDAKNTFIQPYVLKENGGVRMGFRFNPAEDPEKRIPELYAQHIKKARLDWEDSSSIFIQDLYRYYMRACVELMSKYFEKKDKYTFLYDDVPLFVPNEGLEEAEVRLKSMKSRARKKRKMSFSPC